jgi:hypothetical protein
MFQVYRYAGGPWCFAWSSTGRDLREKGTVKVNRLTLLRTGPPVATVLAATLG